MKLKLKWLIGAISALVFSLINPLTALAGNPMLAGTPTGFKFNGISSTGSLACDIDYDLSATGVISGAARTAVAVFGGTKTDQRYAQVRVVKVDLKNLDLSDRLGRFEGRVIVSYTDQVSLSGGEKTYSTRVGNEIYFSNPVRVFNQTISSFAFDPNLLETAKMTGSLYSRDGRRVLEALGAGGNKRIFANCPSWIGQSGALPPQGIRG
jgi:hypothetical protein